MQIEPVLPAEFTQSKEKADTDGYVPYVILYNQKRGKHEVKRNIEGSRYRSRSHSSIDVGIKTPYKHLNLRAVRFNLFRRSVVRPERTVIYVGNSMEFRYL